MDTVLSILNFETGGKKGRAGLITSPRSLEACLRQGVDPKDLLPVPYEAYAHSDDFKRRLTPEEQTIKYEHMENRRKNKIRAVREERERLIAHGSQEATLQTQMHDSDGINNDVHTRAAALKSAMMDMERKRIEAVRRRQEKELQRMIEGEKNTSELHKKLVQAQEEEVRRRKAHEKAVEEARLVEIERKKERDRELKRQEAEEEKKRKDMQRRENERKDKLLAEAKVAEKQRRKDALERELEHIAKLDALRGRTEALMAAQERLAERNRAIIEERDAKVRAQVEEKKRVKAIEIADNRSKAEKRIKDALERNQEIQAKKRRDYDERVAAAVKRASEKDVELLESVKKQADDRKKKEDTRYKRLLDAAGNLRDRIQHTIDRAQGRSNFYSVVAAKKEKEMLQRKLHKDLSQDDKLDNVKRIQLIEEFLRREMMHKQELDDLRYEKIKDERNYLIQQRKQTAQLSLIRKHRLKDAMEMMRVTNKYQDLDQLLGSTGDKKRRRRKGDTAGDAANNSGPNLAAA